MNESKQSQGWIKKHLFSLILLIAVLILSFWAVRYFKKPGQMTVIESQAMDMTTMKAPLGSVPVATEIVHRTSFLFSPVKYTGSVAPFNEQNVYPRVEGWITGLKVYTGDKVKAGQLLAVIDSPDIGSQAAEASYGSSAARTEIPIAQANLSRTKAERDAVVKEHLAAGQDKSASEAQVSAAEKLVIQAQKELNSSKATLVYRKAEFKRAANLLKQGAVSQEEYDSELASMTSAEADVEFRQARVEESDANLKAAQAVLKYKVYAAEAALDRVRAASAAIDVGKNEILQKHANARTADAARASADSINQYRYVRAPFDGMVTNRFLSPGVLVKTDQPILNIAQMDKVRLQANIPDADRRLIIVGTKVTVRFPKDLSRAEEAVITSISPRADQETGTVVAEAIVDNPDMRLYPGDFVVMQITPRSDEKAITVPSSAIVSVNGKTAVWIVKHTKSTDKVLYTCPMHPEIIRDHPGTCPKCLMKLVPKTSATGKTASLVYVDLGNSNFDRTQIHHGLNDGDEVIYKGNRYLKEGQMVAPVMWGVDGPQELPPPAGGTMEDMPGMSHKKHSPVSDISPIHPVPAPVADTNSHSDMKKNSAKSMGTAGTKASKTVKKYTCPMHLEFVTTDPNTHCPECGMRLEEVKGKR